jgi:hypothetical protein
MAMAFKVRVIRPDDLLHLQFEFRNLRLDKKSKDGPALVLEDAQQAAYLIVHFPPQTIAEEAAYKPRDSLDDNKERIKTETDEETRRREVKVALQEIDSILSKGPARARLGQPTRLVFQLPAKSNTRIPFTIESLLNWTELALNVTPSLPFRRRHPANSAAAPRRFLRLEIQRRQLRSLTG